MMNTNWFARALTATMTAGAAIAIVACGAAPTEQSAGAGESALITSCPIGYAPSCTSDPDVNGGRPVCSCEAVPVEQDTCTPVVETLPAVLQNHGCSAATEVAKVGAPPGVRVWVCDSEPALAPSWKIYGDQWSYYKGVPVKLVATDNVLVWHRGSPSFPACPNITMATAGGYDCNYSSLNSSCFPTPALGKVLVMQWFAGQDDGGGGCAAMCMIGR
jgi:hypothetical protein